MESRSAQAAPPGELRGSGAVGRVGDFRRGVHMVARGDRIGGVAPRALLRRRLPLRHAILICATERGGSACLNGFPRMSAFCVSNELNMIGMAVVVLRWRQQAADG